MASDLYIFDESSSFRHLNPELFSSNLPFLSNNDPNIIPVDEYLSLFDHFSPPNHHLETLTLKNPSVFDISDVKTEFGSCNNNQTEDEASLMADNNVGKYIQRSFSSNFVEIKPNFQFNNSPNFHYQTLSSPENRFLSNHMRRVYSTGDLQNSSSIFNEESNFKVGRYSAEERKERISKYRAKRTQRNFTKTIKYACRKTLADNRPRIRGRFARNDEVIEIPKNSREDYEDELWNLDGLHEEEEAFVVKPQLQYTNSFW